MNEYLAFIIVFGLFFALLYLGYNTYKTTVTSTKH